MCGRRNSESAFVSALAKGFGNSQAAADVNVRRKVFGSEVGVVTCDPVAGIRSVLTRDVKGRRVTKDGRTGRVILDWV